MFNTNGNNIIIEKGDSAAIKFTLTDRESGAAYMLPEGSILRFGIYYRKSSTEIIKKTAARSDQSADGSVVFRLGSDEMSLDRHDYRYTLAIINAEENKCDTIIGFPDEALFSVGTGCPSEAAGSSECEIAVSIDTAGDKLPLYEGAYSADPSYEDDVVLETANRTLMENITFRKAEMPGNIYSFSSDGMFKYSAEVTVPNTVMSLQRDYKGFNGHTEIEKVVFESGSQLSFNSFYNTFQNCTGLREVIMPDIQLINLCSNIFTGCSSLETVSFGENTKISFASYSTPDFKNCYALSQTSLESILSHLQTTSNQMIPSEYFLNCRAITSLTTPSAINGIQARAFKGCTALGYANLTNLTYFYESVFSGCTALKTVIFGRNLSNANNISASTTNNPFYGCTALEDVQLPSGWNLNLVLSDGSANFTNVLTHDSMVAMIANLYDFSGGTAHTLTLGATNLAKLSAAEIAAATAKNWTLA